MPCADYWHWIPARLHLGCSGSPPLLESLQVPGHTGGSLTQTLIVKSNWKLALPWTSPRDRSLVKASIYAPAIPSGHPEIRARAALYSSRSDRCGYPGSLIMDVGTARITNIGTWHFEDGDTGPLPKCALCWWVTWWEYDVNIHGLAYGNVAQSMTWPVLQFRVPEDLRPYVGWALSHAWAPVADEPWPGTFEDGALPLDYRGMLADNVTVLGLPALFILTS